MVVFQLSGFYQGLLFLLFKGDMDRAPVKGNVDVEVEVDVGIDR